MLSTASSLFVEPHNVLLKCNSKIHNVMYICTLYYVVTIVTIAALQLYPDAHLAGFHLGLSLRGED